ncbi:MAG: extracellular solute-binding protein [Ruminococcaceae bacterium]|nr:extracellular solute-binding protein [Oscillospiraceae bacterium]
MLLKFLRKTSVFLICLSLVAATGCESRRPQAVEESETSSTLITEVDSQTPEENIKLLDDLGGKYKGRTFTIATTNGYLFKNQAGEEAQQSPLERAVASRMDLLKKSFDLKEIKIIVEDSEREIKEKLRNAASKGTHYADMVCVSAELTAELTEMGLLENMYSLPYVDFDADYMPANSIREQSVGDKMFSYSGDATLSMNSATVLFYNKKLLKEADLKPVSMVQNGSFTWNALTDMVKEAAKQGCFGIDTALDNEELLYSVYASAGNKFITIEGGALKANYSGNTAKKVNEINAALFANDKLCPTRVDQDDAIKDFKQGKTAFLVARLDSVAGISGKSEDGNALVEWGILPLPKLSSSQTGYIAPVNDIASCIAVPKSCADSAFAGFMLNAFLAASTNGLDEGLKTTYINYYFWDNDSALMLNLIEDSLCYDYGIFLSSLPDVYDVSTRLLASDDNLELKKEDEQFFYKFSDRVFG